jgi:hypothetical protein
MQGLTWPELVELGAPKMEGQCQISIIYLEIYKICFFIANQIRWIMWKSRWLYARFMLDPLIYVIFMESAWFLGPKAFYIWENWPLS